MYVLAPDVRQQVHYPPSKLRRIPASARSTASAHAALLFEWLAYQDKIPTPRNPGQTTGAVHLPASASVSRRSDGFKAPCAPIAPQPRWIRRLEVGRARQSRMSVGIAMPPRTVIRPRNIAHSESRTVDTDL